MIVILTVAFGALGIYQIPKMVKKKYWTDLGVFCILFALGYTLCLLEVLDIPYPNFPSIIEPILDALNLHY